MSKRPVNQKCPIDATLVDSADMLSAYERLLGAQRELAQVRLALEADPSAAERLLEERREHIQDELHAVAQRIAGKEASTLSAIAVKARVLLDWCERDRDDIVSQLTVSLCRDVLRVVGTDSSDKEARGG